MGLRDSLRLLSQHVARRFVTQGMKLTRSVGFHAVEINKTRCLEDPTYAPWRTETVGFRGCLGLTSDGRASLSDHDVLIKRGTVVVVVGVNHVAAGHALDAQLLAGVTHCILNEYLEGSASRFFDGTAPV